jgi:hypothetical protein
MEGDSSALEEDLYRCIGEADIDSFMNQLIGDTVVMAVHFDVVIDADLCPAPLGIREAMGRQGFEGGFIESLKEVLAGGVELFEGAVI